MTETYVSSRCLPVSDERMARYMGGRYGQKAATRQQYDEAIHACESIRYLDKTVSDVARLYGLQPESLRNQLKRHFPEILSERNRLRQLLGLCRQPVRGLRQETAAKYAAAVELLRMSSLTVAQAAEQTGVTLPGLQQHLLFYHRDIAQQRLKSRMARLDQPREPGRLTSAGRLSRPRGDISQYYAEAVRLYRETDRSIKDIALSCGMAPHNLGTYLRRWHRDVMAARQERRRQAVSQRNSQRKETKD